MTDQPHVTLNDGRSMPQLGLGVWRTPADDAAKVVADALDAGYLAVDTAMIYRNEEGVGEGARGREVFLTTKLWNDDQGYDETLRAFDASAGRLGRDSVDLYLMHWPAPKKDRYVDSWRAMVRLREEGRARSIGVSNFTAEHLRRVIDETGVTPALNQIELHPRFQQRELRAAHAELGVVTESWSPLGQAQILDDPVIKVVADKHGKTPAQAVIPLAPGQRAGGDPQVGPSRARAREPGRVRLRPRRGGHGEVRRARLGGRPHRAGPDDGGLLAPPTCAGQGRGRAVTRGRARPR